MQGLWKAAVAVAWWGCAAAGRGGLLVAYDLIGDAAPGTVAPAVAAGPLAISNGRTMSFTADAAYGSGWGTGSTPDTQRYWTFTVTLPEAGVELSSLDFDGWRTASGPSHWAVRWNQDAFAADLASGAIDTVPSVGTVPGATLTPPGGGALSGAVEFRIYGYNASSSSGRWYLDRVELNGTPLSVPEPAAASLILVALGCGWARRRRLRCAARAAEVRP